MILTVQVLMDGKSKKGGWSSEQISVLGVSRLVKGWKGEILGKDYPEETIKKFLLLKDCHIKPKKPNKRYNLDKNGDIIYTNVKADFVLRPYFNPVDMNITISEQYIHPNWQKMRMHILARDKFKCCECGSLHKTLHVHHLKYKKDKFIWEVPTYYLVTLCEDCHSNEHGRDLRINRIR